jgi:hypothetical protein
VTIRGILWMIHVCVLDQIRFHLVRRFLIKYFFVIFLFLGLGFRPQPEVDKSLILVNKNGKPNERNPYATSLDQYLQVCK